MLSAENIYGELFHGNFKRQTSNRIFVNRSLRLDKIKFFGFDMDYTLATYKSPQYEELAFRILRERLVGLGYPIELSEFQYEPSFPVRGLWFDSLYGTMLKMDQFGNILLCLLGFNVVQPDKLAELYPNKFLKFDKDRIRIMYTLFDLPELYILSCLIHMLLVNPLYTKVNTGVRFKNVFMSYKSILTDVEEASSWMHMGELKKQTLARLDQYLDKDPKLLVLLDKLRTSRTKTFLLTNSDYEYSNAILSYIFDLPDKNGKIRPWTSYFDYIVTDARKPNFFQEGTMLRIVDERTGRCSIGQISGPLESGRIYAGGSCNGFTNLIGARGKDVLYVGDHIYGDILKSKSTNGWKTFLIIPELLNEIYVWKTKRNLFETLTALDNNLASSYKHMNIASEDRPDVSYIQRDMRATAQQMEEAYGLLGSVFRHGSRLTSFSSQTLRFADIYSYSAYNLIYYPLCYMFRAPPMLMPHESTVSHGDNIEDSFKEVEESPCGLRRRTKTEINQSSQLTAPRGIEGGTKECKEFCFCAHLLAPKSYC